MDPKREELKKWLRMQVAKEQAWLQELVQEVIETLILLDALGILLDDEPP